MLITQYNDFLFEAADSDKLYPLIISERLLKALKSIKSKISQKLIQDFENKVPHKITYLDYTPGDEEKADKISYLPVDRLLRNPDMKDFYTSRLRQDIAAGGIANKLFSDAFDKEDVVNFVNEYKAKLAEHFSDFYMAQGEEIRHWYFQGNYIDENKGSINSSCMRHKASQPYFDIYCKNPEKVKLLVLFADKQKTKIKGRALVWVGLKKPVEIVGDKKLENKIYLDRIYTVSESDTPNYINYAKQKGWLYKAAQVMHDAAYIDNGKIIRDTVAITLKPQTYKTYPSLDTFPYYTPSTGRLASYAGYGVPGHPRIVLQSTNGGYNKID